MQLLLCEDDEAYAESFIYAMETYAPEFAITHTATLSAGLHAVNTHAFDLIVLDLNLPDAKGTAGLLAMSQDARGIPIVVLTAYSQWQTDCERLTCDAYVVKASIDCEHLAALLLGIARRRNGATSCE